MTNIKQYWLAGYKVAILGLLGMLLGTSQVSAMVNTIWAVDTKNNISYRVGVSTQTPIGLGWQKTSGSAAWVAAAPNGVIFCLGTNGIAYHTTQTLANADAIKPNPMLWQRVGSQPTNFKQIAVTTDGTLLALGTNGVIYNNTSRNANGLPGTSWAPVTPTINNATYIAGGPNKTVYYISSVNSDNPAGYVYYKSLIEKSGSSGWSVTTDTSAWISPLTYVESGVASGVSGTTWYTTGGNVYSAANGTLQQSADANAHDITFIAAGTRGLVCLVNSNGSIFGGNGGACFLSFDSNATAYKQVSIGTQAAAGATPLKGTSTTPQATVAQARGQGAFDGYNQALVDAANPNKSSTPMTNVNNVPPLFQAQASTYLSIYNYEYNPTFAQARSNTAAAAAATLQKAAIAAGQKDGAANGSADGTAMTSSQLSAYTTALNNKQQADNALATAQQNWNNRKTMLLTTTMNPPGGAWAIQHDIQNPSSTDNPSYYLNSPVGLATTADNAAIAAVTTALANLVQQGGPHASPSTGTSYAAYSANATDYANGYNGISDPTVGYPAALAAAIQQNAGQ